MYIYIYIYVYMYNIYNLDVGGKDPHENAINVYQEDVKVSELKNGTVGIDGVQKDDIGQETCLIKHDNSDDSGIYIYIYIYICMYINLYASMFI
jgi:hypothetical protein